MSCTGTQAALDYINGGFDYVFRTDRRSERGRLAQFTKAGISLDALAARLQDEGAKSFVKSWRELLEVIASKSATLRQAA